MATLVVLAAVALEDVEEGGKAAVAELERYKLLAAAPGALPAADPFMTPNGPGPVW